MGRRGRAPFSSSSSFERSEEVALGGRFGRYDAIDDGAPPHHCNFIACDAAPGIKPESVCDDWSARKWNVVSGSLRDADRGVRGREVATLRAGRGCRNFYRKTLKNRLKIFITRGVSRPRTHASPAFLTISP